jgi:uncharacterized membrane protein YkvA (DUF1232 family)
MLADHTQVHLSDLSMPSQLDTWTQRARALKTETYAVYLAGKDPRVPWYAKVLIAFVVLHTLSPIDLIPDFIPVLGYLDDLIIAPLGIALSIKMIPADVLAESRAKAQTLLAEEKPTSRVGAAIVIAIWLIIAALFGAVILRIVKD